MRAAARRGLRALPAEVAYATGMRRWGEATDEPARGDARPTNFEFVDHLNGANLRPARGINVSAGNVAPTGVCTLKVPPNVNCAARGVYAASAFLSPQANRFTL